MTVVPYVSVTMSTASLNGTGTNVYTKIPLDTVGFKDASSTYDTVNFRWTPGIDGYYQISGSVFYSAATIYLDMAIFVSGTQINRSEINPDGGALVNAACASALLHLTNTDYVEWFARSQTSTTWTMANGISTWGTGILMGAAATPGTGTGFMVPTPQPTNIRRSIRVIGY